MKKRSLTFILSCLLLALVGCERGCTTSSTMDSETMQLTVNGQDVKVIARLVDYRNSRAINRNIFHRSVTHTYGISFDLAMKGFLEKDFFLEGVDDPDNVDLEAQLKRVKVKFSKDKKHIGLGVDGVVVDIIHLYKNERIETQSALFDPSESIKWSSLNLEKYPDAADYFIKEIEMNCDMASVSQQQIFSFLDDCKPSGKAHRLMLENWPECFLAENYYNKTRIQKLSQDKNWKKLATQRGMEALRENSFFGSKEGLYSFAESLNSKELNALLDSVYVENWGSKSDLESTEIILNRLKSKTNPLAPETRKIILSDARDAFNEFVSSGDSDFRREASVCLHVIVASGDTMTAHTFLHNAMGENFSEYNIFDFIETVYENFPYFTKAQQRYIKRRTPDLFEQAEDYARSIYFDAAQVCMSCNQLKSWKKQYRNDLEFSRLPRNCGP